ncbi:MAG: riboflavin synthase subunit alpha [Legionellaceae bacterium]|nr:riboflavin synthase subunit alpha [Legionellaceae bacterium]MBP9775061.1 riboflavin synthase subunit alpha [Legionellaceae bacterium]
MYSGITSGLFEVTSIEKKPGFMTYSVRFNAALLDKLKVGASVSIDGVCQTVVSIIDHDVTFNAIQDTLDRTTLPQLQLGSKVSVERSLNYGDEVGGHEVAGHVIGRGTVHAVRATENNLDLIIQCPPEWMKYIFTKGFIAVDGSSLTVDQAEPKGFFTLHLIPETLRLTNFGHKRLGDSVNIELDHRTQTIVATVERVLAEMQLS